MDIVHRNQAGRSGGPISVENPTLKNTCAIVVAFHPDETFTARIGAIVEQFAHVFVVDNSEPPRSVGSVPEIRDPRVTVGGCNGNVGVGGALNIGLDLARAAGFAWAMTLDQDTTLAPGALARMASMGPFSGIPVLVGPNYFDMNKRRVSRRLRLDVKAVRVTTLITSGMLCPVDFAVSIGGFRGEFFIDSIDHEFCLRAGRNGAASWMVNEVLMDQPIGVADLRPAWVRRIARNHPAFRKYYLARNTLLTVGEYALFYPGWAARQILRVCGELLASIASNRGSGAQAALLRGIADGLAGRVGRRE